MSKQSALLTIATVIGAFAVGRLLSPDPAPPETPAAPRVAAMPPQGATAAEIRAAIRSEMQRELPVIVNAQKPTPPEPTQEELDRRAKAAEKGRSLVSSALGAGKWTSTDARDLLQILPNLGPEEHDEIMSALIAPVNQGRIKVETNGSLLDPS